MLAPSRRAQHSDERLAAAAGADDEHAFELLYDRNHRQLLSFARHMLGSREDAEDVLQQTFVRAHRALRAGQRPDHVRAWLFAIARNRCRTLQATRPTDVGGAAAQNAGFDDVNDIVQRRADLQALLGDLATLPDEQRAALVLAEIGGLSQAAIGQVLGVGSERVKALVYQARQALISERDARALDCGTIRRELAVATGGALRRGPLRRHLRSCASCRAFQTEVRDQREALALALPVLAAAGLRGRVLSAAAAGGHGTAAGSAGGSLAAKLAAPKVALALAALVGVGAAGGIVLTRSPPPRARAVTTRATTGTPGAPDGLTARALPATVPAASATPDRSGRAIQTSAAATSQTEGAAAGQTTSVATSHTDAAIPSEAAASTSGRGAARRDPARLRVARAVRRVRRRVLVRERTSGPVAVHPRVVGRRTPATPAPTSAVAPSASATSPAPPPSASAITTTTLTTPRPVAIAPALRGRVR